MLDHGQQAGHGTDTLPAALAYYVPLTASGRSVGVLGLVPTQPGQFRDPAQRRLLLALAAQAGAAIDRLSLADQSRRSAIEVEAERLRTALLSGLSHDMRTPLAAIEGAATTLLQEAGPADPATRRELAGTIVQESQRMTRLVANLLDMIRVETGSLGVHREWNLLPEIVGVALIRTEDQLRGHRVTTALPPDLPLVPVDDVLLEQVFVNLLENAARLHRRRERRSRSRPPRAIRTRSRWRSPIGDRAFRQERRNACSRSSIAPAARWARASDSASPSAAGS